MSIYRTWEHSVHVLYKENQQENIISKKFPQRENILWKPPSHPSAQSVACKIQRLQWNMMQIKMVSCCFRHIHSVSIYPGPEREAMEISLFYNEFITHRGYVWEYFMKFWFRIVKSGTPGAVMPRIDRINSLLLAILILSSFSQTTYLLW